jgi:hypothetical protein
MVGFRQAGFPSPAKISMHPDTAAYNRALAVGDRKICNLLARVIDQNLPEAENKIWHAHPVWFLDGNPVVGNSKQKDCIRLVFWSGQSFAVPVRKKSGTFKSAEARYRSTDKVDLQDVERWRTLARDSQWG